MRRQGGSSESPVACSEDLRHLPGPEPPLSDFEQRSSNRTHHVLKEPIAADREYPRRLRTTPRSFEYRSCTVLNLCRRCTE
jgi:hypothetical protein